VPHVDLAATAAPIRTQVREAIARAWERAVASGALPALEDTDGGPAIEVERPAKPEHGDFATNLAMKLARPLRRAPLQIAGALAAELATDDGPIAAAEAAPPGFLNLRLRPEALVTTIDGILAAPASWGRIPPVHARRVNVEFVSANPTGPLTVGNARGAFVGDLLSRVLEAGGQTVTREYYFNDSGGQITKLGASVAALARGEPVPDDGYNGAYVRDLVVSMPADFRERALARDATVDEELGTWAGRIVREGIERSLEHLGVHFDTWTTEASLHEDGWVGRAVDRLRESGHTYERDGALWFRATAFGDVKDRVIYRGDGRPTYFAADIGYVTEKFSRGFDHLIYIWGADHHGTVDRVRGAAEAMGYPRDHVQMSLYSWVRFIRDGVEIPMSKRAGQFVTLDELLDEVGIDAARWFFASRANTTAIDFDIEQLRGHREALARGDHEEASKFPVYYVQYAHARIASIARKAADAGLTPASSVAGAVDHGPEAALAREVLRLPEVIEDAVLAEETQGVTAYATSLAKQFSTFYDQAKVIVPEEPERSSRRLALAAATQTTLARALGLLGISTPESM
jgi:arginyl-tRNA synthetase